MGRMFALGELFSEVRPESMPKAVYDAAYGEAAQRNGWAEKGDGEAPIFSEAFLYPLLGKDDARFVLAVADEYETLIKKLGREKIRQILRVDTKTF